MTSPLPEDVVALMLYGSAARGEADEASDLDVAAFTRARKPTELESIKRYLEAVQPHANYAIYTTREAMRMAETGSLFLWHLRLEGRILRDTGWLPTLWRRLRPYGLRGALESLNVIETVVGDIVTALRRDATTTPYEAATLFSMVRTMGMAVGQAIGKPTFGRRSAIELLRVTLGPGFLLTPVEVGMLELARLSYSSKAPGFLIDSHEAVLQSALKVKRMIDPVRRHLLSDPRCN